MTNLANLLIAGAAVGGLAAPAAAQYYPQQYPQQQYPYPQQTYPQPGYGYQQGYNQGYTGNPVTDIIDQLLGNRYSVTDRQAVRQCANAARVQAQSQYGGGYGYNQGYRQQQIAAQSLRVTSINNVERRSNGLRVTGTMSSGYAGQYGGQYGYQNRGYATGDISFRCNVDYRGQVTNLRIGGNARRY